MSDDILSSVILEIVIMEYAVIINVTPILIIKEKISDKKIGVKNTNPAVIIIIVIRYILLFDSLNLKKCFPTVRIIRQ